jgi:hypothetical protein
MRRPHDRRPQQLTGAHTCGSLSSFTPQSAAQPVSRLTASFRLTPVLKVRLPLKEGKKRWYGGGGDITQSWQAAAAVNREQPGQSRQGSRIAPSASFLPCPGLMPS